MCYLTLFRMEGSVPDRRSGEEKRRICLTCLKKDPSDRMLFGKAEIRKDFKMKKNWKVFLLGISLLLLATACSGKSSKETARQTAGETNQAETTATDRSDKAILEQDPKSRVTFSFDYDPQQYITFDTSYKDAAFQAEDLEVSQDQIQSEIDDLLTEHEKLEEIKDREAMDGDTLELDYTGTIDGETVYQEKNAKLELGQSGMVSGFDEGLEGSKAGDRITLDLEYPSDYGDESLNGKTVHFEITVHHVYMPVTPDYTDAFIRKYTEYESTDAYEAAVKEKLKQSAGEDAVALWVDTHAQMKDYPQALLKQYEQNLIDNLEMEAKYQYQTDLDTVIRKAGYASREEFLKDSEDSIKAQIRDDMAYAYIAQKEQIQSTVGDYLSYMETFAQTNDIKDAGELLDVFTEKEMRRYYMKKLVSDWILSHA